MSRLGQLAGEFDPGLDHVELDMDQVTRRALGLRKWRLEYSCNGAPFVWHADAETEAKADAIARTALQLQEPAFNGAEATLTACLEA